MLTVIKTTKSLKYSYLYEDCYISQHMCEWKLDIKQMTKTQIGKITPPIQKSISYYIVRSKDALYLVDSYDKKTFQSCHFKLKFKQTLVFLNFSKLVLDGI